MITSIDIKHFRCFDQFSLSGFKRINLIGGMNNAGKTVLLEAVQLGCAPVNENIFESINARVQGKIGEMSKNNPEILFNSLFYQEDKTKPFEIALTKDKNTIIQTFNYSQKATTEELDKNIHAKLVLFLLQQEYVLKITTKKTETNDPHSYWIVPEINKKKFITVGNLPFRDLISVYFSRLFQHQANGSLADIYTKHKATILTILNDMLKKFDSTIMGTELMSLYGEPIIGLILKNGQTFPIDYFGDAIRKIVECCLLIAVCPKDGVLLIDEIENGLHYSKQKEFWKNLFLLAQQQEIQIFATSHSQEMIAAFAECCLENNWEDEGAYFKMSKNLDSNKIKAIPLTIKDLHETIQDGSSFRG
jgi:AAA15 family ATPase/GTPase